MDESTSLGMKVASMLRYGRLGWSRQSADDILRILLIKLENHEDGQPLDVEQLKEYCHTARRHLEQIETCDPKSSNYMTPEEHSKLDAKMVEACIALQHTPAWQ